MIRRFLAVTLAVIGFGLAFAPAPAEAFGQCAANTECGWLYYSDAAHTHLQGGHTTNCQGVLLDWGIKAGFSAFISQGCGNVPIE